MTKPIYNIDGVNINYDARVDVKTDGKYFFRLQKDGIKFFNEKVYGKFSE